MSLKKILSLSLGLVILATVAVLISTGTVGAQSLRLNPIAAAPPTPSVPVSVVNTPLAVTGNVNANIGTPTVNVASLPPISGAVTATLSNTSVTVNNAATAPVLVRDVDNPVNNPYGVSICVSPAGLEGCTTSASTTTVPTATPSGQAVKGLVVEFFSGSCYSVPGGEVLNLVLLVTPPAGTGVQIAPTFVPVNTLTSASFVSYAFSQQTRFYAPPGSTIVFEASYNTASSSTGPPPLFCGATINGYFATQ